MKYLTRKRSEVQDMSKQYANDKFVPLSMGLVETRLCYFALYHVFHSFATF